MQKRTEKQQKGGGGKRRKGKGNAEWLEVKGTPSEVMVPEHTGPCPSLGFPLLIPDTRQRSDGLQGHANLCSLGAGGNLGQCGGITGDVGQLQD